MYSTFNFIWKKTAKKREQISFDDPLIYRHAWELTRTRANSFVSVLFTVQIKAHSLYSKRKRTNVFIPLCSLNVNGEQNRN